MSEEGNKVLCGIDTLFYNSQSLFIEAHDVLSLSWLTMIYYMKESSELLRFFDMSELEDCDIGGVVEWYFTRKHQNLFMNFPMRSGESLPESIGDNLVAQCMNITDAFYQINLPTAFLRTLDALLEEKGLVKKIYIWSKEYEHGMEAWVSQTYGKFGNKVEYIHGPMESVLTTIPNDSTYVFSNIEHLEQLRKSDKLALSAVLICNGYRYNYTLNDKSKLKHDLEEMKSEIVFKGAFFENFDDDMNIPSQDSIIDAFKEAFGSVAE